MTGRLLILAVAASGLMLATAVGQERQEQKMEPPSGGIETKSLLDNEQMRVVEMRFKPGAKTETLSHPNRFLYALTDGSLVFSPPGKTPYELSFKRGEALWLPADSTATQNDGDEDVRTLVVELKSQPHAASAGTAAKGKQPGGKHGKKASSGRRTSKK